MLHNLGHGVRGKYTSFLQLLAPHCLCLEVCVHEGNHGTWQCVLSRILSKEGLKPCKKLALLAITHHVNDCCMHQNRILLLEAGDVMVGLSNLQRAPTVASLVDLLKTWHRCETLRATE